MLSSEWISLKEYEELFKNNELETINIYQSPHWLKLIKNSFKVELKILKTIKNSESIAFTPFVEKRRGPFLLIGSPLRGTYTEFCGPILKKNVGKNDLREIIISQHKIIKKNNYIEWKFIENSKFEEDLIEEFYDLGYEHFDTPSIKIDLTKGKEDIWKGFTGRARNMIRKAEKIQLEANKIYPSKSWIKSYYRILSENFSRQGLATPHPISFFLNLRKLAKLEMVSFYNISYKNELDAAAIFVNDKSRVMYLSGVATKEGMKSAANSLIQWQIIQDSIINNSKTYDLGGLGIPSIDKFKKSFGGEIISHKKWVRQSKFFKIIEPIAVWTLKKGILR